MARGRGRPRKDAIEMPPPSNGATQKGNGIDIEQLRSLIDRVERLEDEKRAIDDDLKVIYAEARRARFDVKTMRLIIKERRMDEAERAEQQTLVELYREALGMLADTPLGTAAMAAAEEMPRQKLAPVVAPQHDIAWEKGFADGLAGNEDNAGEWPPGVYGHASYHLGHREGEKQHERSPALSP